MRGWSWSCDRRLVRAAASPNDEEQHSDRRGDHRDANRCRQQVAENRMLVVGEAVTVKERVVPKARVVAKTRRHRVEVVLLQIQVFRCVLTERATGSNEAERR